MNVLEVELPPQFGNRFGWMDTETGETDEKKLEHATGEAERFYRQLQGAL